MNATKILPVILRAQHIVTITGMSERHAYKVMALMRVFFNKRKGQFLTMEEYSVFSGLTLEQIYYRLGYL